MRIEIEVSNITTLQLLRLILYVENVKIENILLDGE